VDELPLEHVQRTPLPWRTESKTECGRPAAEYSAVLTRDEFFAKVKKQGKQRAAMSTCMTCMETASRHTTWGESPSSVMSRELTTGRYDRNMGEKQIDRELRAIAALIEAHGEEFHGYLSGLDQTVSLRERRLRSATR
jgi:hypothetical protein